MPYVIPLVGERKGEIGLTEVPLVRDEYLYRVEFKDGSSMYYFEKELKEITPRQYHLFHRRNERE